MKKSLFFLDTLTFTAAGYGKVDELKGSKKRGTASNSGCGEGEDEKKCVFPLSPSLLFFHSLSFWYGEQEKEMSDGIVRGKRDFFPK